MTEHTVKSFGSELDALSTDVARMGGLVESLVNDSITAVVRRDTALGPIGDRARCTRRHFPPGN